MNLIKKCATQLVLTLMLLVSSAVVFAQEKSAEIDVNINKGGESNWYASPWVWVVGGALFILLLVALLRGNNARD